MVEENKTGAILIDNTKDLEQNKKPTTEKCPYCDAVVQTTAERCAKCGKNLRDKKAIRKRAINDGTCHDKLTLWVAIVTGSILLLFIVIAIIGNFI